MHISIIICTYNRSQLLEHCLNSLLAQDAAEDLYEVIIVDNNSSDDTKEITQQYLNKSKGNRYVLEEKQGLSHARNRGYKEAKTNWICYLDDDATAKENYISRIIWFTNNKPYSFFGGVYLPWYLYGRPIWFKDKYASNKKKYKNITVLPSNEFVSGGVMVIKKELLDQSNGFSPELGMTGNKIAYGEETSLQIFFRNKGYEIAYDPELVIHHVVAKQKLRTGFFIESSYAKGRDMIKMEGSKSSKINLILTSIVLLGFTFLRLIYYTPKLLSKDYYSQNWFIDVFSKSAKRIGFIYHGIINKLDISENKE